MRASVALMPLEKANGGTGARMSAQKREMSDPTLKTSSTGTGAESLSYRRARIAPPGTMIAEPAILPVPCRKEPMSILSLSSSADEKA
jgi:hypothetical protein